MYSFIKIDSIVVWLEVEFSANEFGGIDSDGGRFELTSFGVSVDKSCAVVPSFGLFVTPDSVEPEESTDEDSWVPKIVLGVDSAKKIVEWDDVTELLVVVIGTVVPSFGREDEFRVLLWFAISFPVDPVEGIEVTSDGCPVLSLLRYVVDIAC